MAGVGAAAAGAGAAGGAAAGAAATGAAAVGWMGVAAAALPAGAGGCAGCWAGWATRAAATIEASALGVAAVSSDPLLLSAAEVADLAGAAAGAGVAAPDEGCAAALADFGALLLVVLAEAGAVSLVLSFF